MFASRAALFPLQREPFSCRNTHPFQQNLISPSYSLDSFWRFFLCLQDVFHRNFRFLFSLFTFLRNPYSCPSIERNQPAFLSGFHNGFINNLTAIRDAFYGVIATEVA